MQRFLTRTDLIRYAQAHINSRACQRAFDTGRVDVLGGFHPLSPSTQPGWLMRVTSKFGRSWLIAVTTSADVLDEYGVWEADSIPWENWIGEPNRRKRPPDYIVHDGDDPLGSFLNKMRCKHGSMDNSTRSGRASGVVDRRLPDSADHLQLGPSRMVGE